MIARIFIPLLLLIVLPALYIDWRLRCKKVHGYVLKRVLRWLMVVAMTVYTCILATVTNFMPQHANWLYFYLFLLGVWVIPQVLYALCSAVGLLCCRLFKRKKNYGNLVGWLLALICVFITVYGSTFGVNRMQVARQDVYFKDLPDAFDGYRLLHVSDLHVGTFGGSRQGRLAQVIDSINAQHADAVVFTGDLQNILPQELTEHRALLSSIRAKDGVYSVLGNHDYSQYIEAEPAVKRAYEQQTVDMQRSFGWTLLLNEHRIIRRGSDSLVIAGEENDGLPPFPHKADIRKTLAGVRPSAFVVLLQHDPSAWERSILPHSSAQLTLSGHTHGGQISLFGLRPTQLQYAQDRGLYTRGNRKLYVSTGVGGTIPFRFGVPPQITVITLRKQK